MFAARIAPPFLPPFLPIFEKNARTSFGILFATPHDIRKRITKSTLDYT